MDVQEFRAAMRDMGDELSAKVSRCTVAACPCEAASVPLPPFAVHSLCSTDIGRNEQRHDAQGHEMLCLGMCLALTAALPLQTVSTIFSAMDVHGWLTFNEFVQIVEVCFANQLPSCFCARQVPPVLGPPSMSSGSSDPIRIAAG